MKKITILFAMLLSAFAVNGQKISIPFEEIRVDTLRSRLSEKIIFVHPIEVYDGLTVSTKGAPKAFLIEAVDSAGYRRFGVTMNGALVAGTNHDPEFNTDALALVGRYNSVKGADAVAIGKGIKNLADTAMALGYHYDVPETKKNTTIVGYGNNRIEMDADSGRFVGKWKLGSGSGGAETDPIWNAEKSGYMITSPNFAYSESGISGNILPSLAFGRGKIEAYSINTTGQGYKIGFGSSPLSNNITISESGDIDLAGINSRLVLSSSLGAIQLLSENYTTLAANRTQSGTVTRADLTGNGMRYITTGTSTSLDILSSSIQNESFIWKKYADDNYLSSNQGKIYTQAAEPDIPSNSFGFWVNTSDQTFWLMLDSSGVQKKIQLQ